MVERGLEMEGWGCRRVTYGVADGEFLFGADDGAAAGGGVEGSFAAHYGLSLRGGALGFASDLGDRVPVVHVCG